MCFTICVCCMDCHSKVGCSCISKIKLSRGVGILWTVFPISKHRPTFDTCYSGCEKHIMQGGNVDILGVIKVLVHWMLGILK